MRLPGGVAAGLVALAVFSLLLVLWPGQGARRTSTVAAAAASISARELLPHISFLADDLLEGRAPSTRGGELAARYLASQLALLGYVPAGDDGTWFQQVPLLESEVASLSRLSVGGAGPLALGTDIVPFGTGAEPRLDVSAEIVFVGHGIVAPEHRWDDYAETDVAGRVVMVMVNEPRPTSDEPGLFDGEALSYYGRWTYKLEEAARHGAAGVLLVHTDGSATYPWSIVETSWGGVQYLLPEDGIARAAVRAWVTDEAARRIALAGGHDLDALRGAAFERGSRPTSLGVRLEGTLLRRVERRESPNVVGRLAGTDPSEAVVITAHYDHLGMRAPVPGEDHIFNGAVDNASGVAGALAVARALAAAGEAPRRSIYVLFTTAEESGLLGAEHFVRRPPVPLPAIAAVVNIDELNVFGPSRDLVLVGSGRSSIGALAREAARARGRGVVEDPDAGQGTFFRSDHFPFARAGVPRNSRRCTPRCVRSMPAAPHRVR